MSPFATTPEPPYHAVIFSSRRRGPDAGYSEMAARMEERAATQPGFLGIESARDAEGFGITVSYWADEAALIAWKEESQHLLAQRLGRTRWYEHYTLRVAVVQRAYEGPAGRDG